VSYLFTAEYIENWVLGKDPQYQKFSNREAKWQAVYTDPTYQPLVQCIQQQNPLWLKQPNDFAKKISIFYKESSDPAYMTAHDIAAQVQGAPTNTVAISLSALKSKMQHLNLAVCLCNHFQIPYQT
jgi:hypothetical protein